MYAYELPGLDSTFADDLIQPVVLRGRAGTELQVYVPAWKAMVPPVVPRAVMADWRTVAESALE